MEVLLWQKMKFFKCKDCDMVFEVVSEGKGCSTATGNDKVEKLEAKTQDASTEKHVPYVEEKENGYLVKLEDREILTKTVINASGVFADELNAMVSKDQFKIIPRKGEYFLLDKVQGTLTNSVIFQCPTALGKGVLVAQTIHGNLITGPTALDIDDKEDVAIP